MSPDGRLLAVGCCDPSPDSTRAPARMSRPTWSASPMARSGTSWPGTRSMSLAVAFRPDGKCLATLGDEGTIRVWDTVSGRELRAIGLGRGSSAGAAVRGAALEPGRPAARLRRRGRPGPDLGSRDRTGDGPDRPRARSVAWSPDGTRIASAERGSGLGVRLWDARDGRSCGPALGQSGSIRSLAWSPDGRRLAAVSTDHDDGCAPGSS